MVTFLKMTLRAFKGFRNEQTFEFTNRPSLFRLLGRNLIKPHLGPNGTGKSTIWDGLSWCLYGQSVRGLKASDIVSWDSSQVTAVSTYLLIDGLPHVITRTQAPNLLKITYPDNQTKIVVQADIDKLIGINFKAFLFSVIFGQFNQVFFDLSSAEKLSVFNDVLDLGTWDRAAIKARELASAADSECSQYRQQLSRLEGNLEARKVNKIKILDQLKAAEDLKDIKHQQLIFTIERSTKNLNDSNEKLTQKKFDLETLKAKRDALKTRQLGQQKNYDQSVQSVNYLAVKSEETEKAYDLLVKKKNKILTIDEEVNRCPVCYQTISGETRDQLESDISKEILKRRVDLSEMKTQHEEQTVILGQNRLLLNESIEKYDRSVERVAEAQYQIHHLIDMVRRDKESIKATHVLIDTNSKMTKTLEDDLIIESSMINDLKKETERYQSSLDESEGEYLTNLDWVQHFKKVKLFVVEKALKELEIETNNCLTELGLGNWKIEFVTEFVNRSNMVTNKFEVMIKPEGRSDVVRWENFSGGETQRLRIAGAIGLANLIRSRSGFNSNIEAWDEPTAHMSVEGVNDLLLFLSERSKIYKKQIWLVDHRSFDNGIFDGEVLIQKELTGSKIIIDKGFDQDAKPKRQLFD